MGTENLLEQTNVLSKQMASTLLAECKWVRNKLYTKREIVIEDQRDSDLSLNQYVLHND